MKEGRHTLSCNCETDDLNSIMVVYSTLDRECRKCECHASYCAKCTKDLYDRGVLIKGHLTDLIDMFSGREYLQVEVDG